MAKEAKRMKFLDHPIPYHTIFWPEEAVKKVVFGCQNCGQCMLSYTALTCPMNCPKQQRNGPCGGTRAGGKCEVYPERACTWNKIFQRAKRLRRLHLLEEVQPPVDWTLQDTSAWVNVFQGKIKPPRLR
ncbi:MAG: methylenetetrahydrofolate reductase C-terminal domain-containing protein [Armatimonadota bacterium]